MHGILASSVAATGHRPHLPLMANGANAIPAASWHGVMSRAVAGAPRGDKKRAGKNKVRHGIPARNGMKA